jgi:hypothetical protein
MLDLIGVVVVAASPFVARSLMRRGRRDEVSGSPSGTSAPGRRQRPSRADKRRATAIAFWATLPATFFWIILALAHPDALYTGIAVVCTALFLTFSVGWVTLRSPS